MFSFFIRHCQIVFQNIYAILHSHQQWMGVLLVSHSCHLVLSMLLILAILIRCAVVSWHYFSLWFPNDVMLNALSSVPVCHLFIFFGGEVSVKIFAYFLIRLFFSCWALRVLCIVLNIQNKHTMNTGPSRNVFANIFSQPMGCPSILLTVSFAKQKF